VPCRLLPRCMMCWGTSVRFSRVLRGMGVGLIVRFIAHFNERATEKLL
jgi:hypothetical protein